jgi:acetyl esterase/lipase
MDAPAFDPAVEGAADSGETRARLRARVDARGAEQGFALEEKPGDAVKTPRWAPLAAAALSRLERAAGASARRVRSRRYGQGPRRTLDIYLPRARARRPRPVIVFFHGGAWRSGSKEETAFVGLSLARMGHVVVMPNHRLVPEVRFPTFLEDAAEAVGWTHGHIDRHGGDPDRIALMGHSAGAHTAMMLGLDRAYLAGVGAPHEAVRALVGLSGPYDFHPFPLQLCVDAFGAARDPMATQPVAFARPDAPPTLLIAGDKDRHVPPENTLSMAEALRAAGARCEARIEAGAGHIGPLVGLSHVLGRRMSIRRRLAEFLASAGMAPPAPQGATDGAKAGFAR